MVRTIKVTFLLFLTALLLNISANPAFAQKQIKEDNVLKFSIEFEKTVFKEGEPVNCTMVLTNTGKTALIVNKRFLVNFPAPMPHEVFFVIKNEKGDELPFQLRIKAGDPKAKDFAELLPGKSIKSSDIFGIVQSKGYNLTEAYDLKIPGVYTVYAVYENKTKPEGMNNVWTGKIVSNNIKITIKK